VIFAESPLAGAFVIDLQRIEDNRGFFARGWCSEEFRAQGLVAAFTQLNVGFSKARGTVRGLHFQVPPYAEAKFVRCTRGAIYDVIVDLRRTSGTFCQWFAVELTASNGRMLYVPEGFAQGYQTLADESEMCYLTSRQYEPKAARGVRFNDPAFSIRWPLDVSVISRADQEWPDFAPTAGFPD
jgi:dTDP-4-dehydrorhamnose 3,5-epimerase